jgi:hypothetical protein
VHWVSALRDATVDVELSDSDLSRRHWTDVEREMNQSGFLQVCPRS